MKSPTWEAPNRCEAWTTGKAESQTTQAFNMQCCRRMLQPHWTDKVQKINRFWKEWEKGKVCEEL